MKVACCNCNLIQNQILACIELPVTMPPSSHSQIAQSLKITTGGTTPRSKQLNEGIVSLIAAVAFVIKTKQWDSIKQDARDFDVMRCNNAHCSGMGQIRKVSLVMEHNVHFVSLHCCLRLQSWQPIKHMKHLKLLPPANASSICFFFLYSAHCLHILQ